MGAGNKGWVGCAGNTGWAMGITKNQPLGKNQSPGVLNTPPGNSTRPINNGLTGKGSNNSCRHHHHHTTRGKAMSESTMGLTTVRGKLNNLGTVGGVCQVGNGGHNLPIHTQ